MVFRLITKQKETSSSSIMASSSTVKPHHHPLHNFPLQDLKWPINHNSNTHHRIRHNNNNNNNHNSPHRYTSTTACDGVVKKAKIFIRIRTKISNTDDADDAVLADTNHTMDDDGDAEETLTKTWNLRPRKPLTKIPLLLNRNNGNNGGGAIKIGGAVSQEIKTQELSSRTELTRSQRNVNNNDNNSNKKDKEKEIEKGKKVKFSISLTKEETEDDFYALTGSKPARRPKRRAKHVQKQLDCLFPGLWLASVTPDVYRVPDAPPKG